MRYASKTGVSSDKSQSEIKKTLQLYGASSFAFIEEGRMAAIAFQANGRRIRMVVPLPDPKDFEKSPAGKQWPKERALKAWEQAGRQRWRALALVVKAKLEAVESGVATFEAEFLPYTLLPNGKTAGEWMLPQISKSYENGKMPPLLLGAGEP